MKKARVRQPVPGTVTSVRMIPSFHRWPSKRSDHHNVVASWGRLRSATVNVEEAGASKVSIARGKPSRRPQETRWTRSEDGDDGSKGHPTAG